MRRASVICAMAVAMASLVTACDNASTTGPTVTVAHASTTSSAGAPGTSAASTSTTTSTTTTVPATTTTTLDDLKAQIAADFQRSYISSYDLLGNPSLDNLDARVDEYAVPGSEFHATLVATIQDLVAKGDRLIANNPDVLRVTVESVELVGGPPYTEAKVTSCQVENRKRVTPAENSPTGTEIEVGDSGMITAYHTVEPLRLTDKGWLPYSANLTGDIFKGQDSC